MSQTGSAYLRGPHHCAMWRAWVQTSNTSSRGASNTRVISTSRSETTSNVVSEDLLLVVIGLCLLVLVGLALQLAQVFVEPIEARFPDVAIGVDPVGGLFEPRW